MLISSKKKKKKRKKDKKSGRHIELLVKGRNEVYSKR